MLRSVLRRLPTPVKDAIKSRVYPSPLEEGATAPDWHLQSWDGSWHRAQPNRWSVLVFYPGDGTLGCTRQLQELQAHRARLDALGADVYGINPAEAESHRAFAEAHAFTFPLLTDRGGSVARQFRCTVPLPGGPQILRTVYLLNPDRKIRLRNRGAPPVEAIVRSIEALQQASRTGR
jgi:peroxiredoxin Q/BCP